MSSISWPRVYQCSDLHCTQGTNNKKSCLEINWQGLGRFLGIYWWRWYGGPLSFPSELRYVVPYVNQLPLNTYKTFLKKKMRQRYYEGLPVTDVSLWLLTNWSPDCGISVTSSLELDLARFFQWFWVDLVQSVRCNWWPSWPQGLKIFLFEMLLIINYVTIK